VKQNLGGQVHSSTVGSVRHDSDDGRRCSGQRRKGTSRCRRRGTCSQSQRSLSGYKNISSFLVDILFISSFLKIKNLSAWNLFNVQLFFMWRNIELVIKLGPLSNMVLYRIDLSTIFNIFLSHLCCWVRVVSNNISHNIFRTCELNIGR
jgi:hypothetical protein